MGKLILKESGLQDIFASHPDPGEFGIESHSILRQSPSSVCVKQNYGHDDLDETLALTKEEAEARYQSEVAPLGIW
jgi:hypothetical protein